MSSKRYNFALCLNIKYFSYECRRDRRRDRDDKDRDRSGRDRDVKEESGFDESKSGYGTKMDTTAPQDASSYGDAPAKEDTGYGKLSLSSGTGKVFTSA